MCAFASPARTYLTVNNRLSLGFLSLLLLFDSLEKFLDILDYLLANSLVQEISAVVWHTEPLDLSKNIENI